MTIMDKACYERGCACYDSRDGEKGVEVVAKREWVGLTPEDKEEIQKLSTCYEQAVELTEAKLKELNT